MLSTDTSLSVLVFCTFFCLFTKYGYVTDTHICRNVLVFIVDAQRDRNELLKGRLHPLLDADGVVAQDEIEARLDVGALAHDVLKGCDGVRVLAHADEDHADVLQDLDPHSLVCIGDLIQCHAVELNCLGVVFLFEVDVGHVDFQSACREQAQEN